MLKHIFTKVGELVRKESAEPICGTDFCDTCGDCLHCFYDAHCYPEGDHYWVAYEPAAEAPQ